MSAEIIEFPRYGKRRLARRRVKLEAQAATLPEQRVAELAGWSLRAMIDIVQDDAMKDHALVLVDRLLGHFHELVRLKLHGPSNPSSGASA